MAVTVGTPSTSPLYGASTAVSAMSAAQLTTYYYQDVSLGAYATATNFHGPGGPQGCGLKQLLADGRTRNGQQDWIDAVFIRNQVISTMQPNGTMAANGSNGD